MHMLMDLFYWVVNMGIVGGIVGLVMLLLRRLPFIPKGILYPLWLVPLLRFLLPFGLSGRYGLMGFLTNLLNRRVIALHGGGLVTTNMLMLADGYFPVRIEDAAVLRVFEVAALVWVIGFAALLIAAAVLYAISMAQLKDARHLERNVYESEKISAPAVYGVFRQRIILPKALPRPLMEHVLLHEGVHVRRRDNLWRMLALFTACLHWFNPMAWLLLRAFYADMELSCDAAAVRGLDLEQRRAYAGALLGAVAGRDVFAAQFGGAKLKIRIESVLLYRPLTIVSSIFFGALVLFVAAALLLNAPVL